MLEEIKKILVAIDFSSQAKKTFLYASSLADKTGADLIILSVLNQRDIDAAAVYSRLTGSKAASVEVFTTSEINRRKLRVDEVLDEVGLGHVQKETVIRVGKPFKEILKAINEFGVDIVVMGTRGRGSDKDYQILTGSVAEKVFKFSPVPVLSIRDDQPDSNN